MEKLNVAERRTYVAPELSIAEFAIENGFGNSSLRSKRKPMITPQPSELL